MKNIIEIFALLLFFSLISCSKKDVSLFSTQDINTLKYSATLEIENIEWTNDIDGYLLYEIKNDDKEESNSTVFKKVKEKEVKINNFQRFFLEKNEIGLNPIYPRLESFGNLNISAIDQDIINLINTFMYSYSKGLIEKSVLNPSQDYLSVLLEYDFEAYPKGDAWLFGEPFISEQSTVINNENQETVLELIYEVPLRVYSENSYFDLIFCLISENEQYFIDQIILGSIISE